VQEEFMKRNVVIALLTLVVLGTLGISQAPGKPGFVPREGFVPNAETAVKIAEAVLIPVYGEKQIISERPFRAVLKDNTWTVEGTLQCAPRCFGGTALVEISKTSGEILLMIHGK
jgi:hypothetical protein